MFVNKRSKELAHSLLWNNVKRTPSFVSNNVKLVKNLTSKLRLIMPFSKQWSFKYRSFKAATNRPIF